MSLSIKKSKKHPLSTRDAIKFLENAIRTVIECNKKREEKTATTTLYNSYMPRASNKCNQKEGKKVISSEKCIFITRIVKGKKL